MDLLLYALAGLVGGALAISIRRKRAAKQQRIHSTMEWLNLLLDKYASDPRIGSIENAFLYLKPLQTLSVVRLVKLLDGNPEILDSARQYSAIPLRDAQTNEGYFDQSFYRPPDLSAPHLLSPAPGATRSDRELYDFECTIEILELLNELEVEVKNRAALVRWIQETQTPEGRFATEARYNQLFAERHPVEEVGTDIRYHHPTITGARSYSEIEETAHAVRALRLLRAEPLDKAACIDWLQVQQQPEGFFLGPSHPDLKGLREEGLEPEKMTHDELAEYAPRWERKNTYWAVMGLHELGAKPRHVESCRDWLEENLVSKNVYHNETSRPINERFIVGWRHIEALYLLGGKLSREDEWLDYLYGKREGGIAHIIGLSLKNRYYRITWDHFVGTWKSFHTLQVMGGLDEEYLSTFK